MNENRITSKGAIVLFNTLQECNFAISNLSLFGNRLDDTCANSLGDFLYHSHSIEILNLGYNLLTDKGIEIIAKFMIGSVTIKELNLCDNENITDVSTPYLLDITKETSLMKIDVDYTSISGKKQHEITSSSSIPVDQREIPLRSNAKSAAKASR